MSVILAYALFILLMAAPFIVAALLVSGVVTGASMLWRGLASGNSTTAILGGLLLGACLIGMVVGWRWATRGSAGEVVVERLEPATEAMKARPRRFVLGPDSSAHEVLDVLGDSFDSIEGTRRNGGRSAKRQPDQTLEQYSAWLNERVKVTLVDRAALLRKDMAAAIHHSPLEPAAPSGVFGINSEHAPSRPNFQLYYHADRKTTVLMRCSMELRTPPILSVLPMGPAMFVNSDTYREGMARLRTCRREMLVALAAELG